MFFLSYRPDESRLVTEVLVVVDLGNELLVERELRRLLPCCGPRTLIVDIHTPLVNSSTLRVLLRVRSHAQEQGVTLAVVARHPSARKVFRVTGLSRLLRVTATLPSAGASARKCEPVAPAAGRPKRRRLLSLFDTPAKRPPGPYSDACRSPHVPEVH